MPDALMYADTFRSPELRHEVPLGVPDPILYAEKDGNKHIVTYSMEAARLAELGLYELHLMDELGIDELRKAGLSLPEMRAELALRGTKAIGITSAVVPETFPLWLADHLRANGIELTVDRDFFDDRRRVKTDAELEGMRRAQRAAEAAMDTARELLRTRVANGGLTVEEVKGAMSVVFAEHGTSCDDFIVAPGAAGCRRPRHGLGPDPRRRAGRGRHLAARQRVVRLLRHDAHVRRRRCRRTTCATWHRLCKEALDRAISEIKDGASGKDIFDGTCEIFEAAGERDAAHEGGRRSRSSTGSSTASATESGSRCTRSRGWD